MLDKPTVTSSGISAGSATSTKVLLVAPKFSGESFWSLTDTCKLANAKTTTVPLGFLTLAAMLPADWDLRLVDCQVEPLTDAHFAWADLVMTGGMLPQAAETVTVIRRAQAAGKPVCVGGADPTSRPEWYAATGAEFLVLGEAEGIIDTFVDAWRRGDRSGHFAAPKFTIDVTKTPIPRYDLVTFSNYLWVAVQFSRGCPFNCEFCDIIELYGRVPRTKTTAQVLAELDHLLSLGYIGHVDFCDDNLIGNKKALKKFLPELIAWQKAHAYPFRFSTEASMNLADDEELLHLLVRANFFLIFVGIESGDTATLISMQKKQNTRRSLAESVQRINAAGILVVAGFIVGFDTERDSVTDDMVRLFEETSIPIGMVGLLTALPNTQMWRRLEKEGRLHITPDIALPDSGAVGFMDAKNHGDQCTAGLNFDTLRPRRDVLSDYLGVLERIYSPEAFFSRLEGVAAHMRRPRVETKIHWRLLFKNLGVFKNLFVELMRRPRLRPLFFRFLVRCLKTNPGAAEYLVLIFAVYLHVGRFSEIVTAEIRRQIADIDAAPANETTKVAA